MIRGLWISASSLSARQHAQEILANNLANVGTPGFRQMRFAFQQAEEAVRPHELPGGSPAPAEAPGLATRLDLAPGPLEMTGSPFDLALAGPGFFVVQGPDGPLYTREAALIRGLDGTLIHKSGHPILTEGGPLTISEDSTFSVSDDGAIVIDGVAAGRLQVVDLGAPAALQPVGQNLLHTEAPGEALLSPRVVQGALESANADPVASMIDMMAVLRAYQANQNAIVTQDESLGQLIRWASS